MLRVLKKIQIRASYTASRAVGIYSRFYKNDLDFLLLALWLIQCVLKVTEEKEIHLSPKVNKIQRQFFLRFVENEHTILLVYNMLEILVDLIFFMLNF